MAAVGHVEVGDGRGEAVDRLGERHANERWVMDEGREVVCGSVEVVPQDEVGDRRGEGVDGLVEGVASVENGGGGREVVNGVVEAVPEEEVGEGGG